MDRPKTPGFERPKVPLERPKTPGPRGNNRPFHCFQVFLRLRPSSPQTSVSDFCFLSAAPGQSNVNVLPPTEHNRTRAIDKYSFTMVFDETTKQLDIFTAVVLPLVQDAVRGCDGMLATLGATGSGKTHTILGNKEQRGMVQLALDVIFSSLGPKVVDYSRFDMTLFDHTEAVVLETPQFLSQIGVALDQGPTPAPKRSSLDNMTPNFPDVSEIIVDADANNRYAILISMYELYNDRIFDLLDETPLSNPNARRKALIFKKPSTQSQWDTSKEQKKAVSGLRKVCARTYFDALQIVEHAQAYRKVSSTSSNLVSSRSHAFLQIEIKRFNSRGVERGSSSLQIVDLAGSERARNSQATGDRLVEAGSINRSLMILGQCLESQQYGNSSKSPAANWRNSKLTEILLSNSFSGISKQRAAMIVTADPMGDFNATLQILKYSALAKEVTIPITPNVRDASRTRDVSMSSPLDAEIDITGEDSKDALIARLIAQLEEAESRWHDAEERCLLIEQITREEVAEEMDRRLQEVRREAQEARVKEGEWREIFVDEKIEILRKGMEDELHVYEDHDNESALAEENRILRREIASLRGGKTNNSSTRTQANMGLKLGRSLGGVKNTVL